MLTLILVFLSGMVLRFILYFDKYRRLRIYRSHYEKYLGGENDDFLQMKRQAVQLFHEAGVADSVIPRETMVTMNMMRTASIPLFNNITAKGDNEIIILTRAALEETIGFFRLRMYQCLNPAFWIEFIVKFPEMLIQSFGVLNESKIPKVMNLLYWITIILIGLHKGSILIFALLILLSLLTLAFLKHCQLVLVGYPADPKSFLYDSFLSRRL